jgi:flavodoxin
VVYYSRTGNTDRVAKAIAAKHGWDLERLVDRHDRSGVLGWARSVVDALLGSRTRLAPLEHDLRNYDVFVIGTPTWVLGPSTPVRAFLREHAYHLRAVALFATCLGRGAGRALVEMERAAGKVPLAMLEIRDAQVATGEHEMHARRFADLVASRLERHSHAA